MVNEEIIRYVQNYLSQGYSKEQISQVLFNNGYNKFQVNEIFNQIEMMNNNYNSFNNIITNPTIPSKKSSKPIVIPLKLIIGIIFSLLIIAILLFFILSSSDDENDILITTTTTTTTTTTLIDDQDDQPIIDDHEETITLFEILLCNDIDVFFNCFENKVGEFKLDSSIFFQIKLFLKSHNINDDFRIGFYQGREIIDPNGNVIDEWSNPDLLDVTRPVPVQGQFSIPVYNELLTLDNLIPGEYIAKFKFRDKFSPYILEFETTFTLTQ